MLWGGFVVGTMDLRIFLFLIECVYLVLVQLLDSKCWVLVLLLGFFENGVVIDRVGVPSLEPR